MKQGLGEGRGGYAWVAQSVKRLPSAQGLGSIRE